MSRKISMTPWPFFRSVRTGSNLSSWTQSSSFSRRNLSLRIKITLWESCKKLDSPDVGHPSFQGQPAGSGMHAVGDLDVTDVEWVIFFHPPSRKDCRGAVNLKLIFGVVKNLDPLVGWLVGCFGFNSPLRQYFSLYWAVSQREGERRGRIDESKNVQTTPTRTCCKCSRPLPYCNQNLGRPGTGSLPSTIAPPDHPAHWSAGSLTEGGTWSSRSVNGLCGRSGRGRRLTSSSGMGWSKMNLSSYSASISSISSSIVAMLLVYIHYHFSLI